MTEPPEVGDGAWRAQQVEVLCQVFPRIALDDGRFHRRPPRHLFADAFEDDGDADILRMYRDVDCPTLIIRCTESGAPAVLDEELDGLVAANPFVSVLQLPLTHLAPAWDALDEVASHIEEFLEAHPF